MDLPNLTAAVVVVALLGSEPLCGRHVIVLVLFVLVVMRASERAADKVKSGKNGEPIETCSPGPHHAPHLLHRDPKALREADDPRRVLGQVGGYSRTSGRSKNYEKK